MSKVVDISLEGLLVPDLKLVIFVEKDGSASFVEDFTVLRQDPARPMGNGAISAMDLTTLLPSA